MRKNAAHPLLQCAWALLLLCLAACSGPAATEDATDLGWVELDDAVLDDSRLDEAVIERVTPEAVVPETLSEAEAQARLPFTYALPDWAPAGFVRQDEVELVQPSSGLGYTRLSFTWLNNAGAALYLHIEQRDDDQPALGAAGSTEAVTVNGQPAALVYTRRLGVERVALTWQRGALTYALAAEAGAVTPEDLRRMAESVA